MIVLEKGRNHLDLARAAVRAVGRSVERRDQVPPPPLPRPRSVPRAADLSPDRGRRRPTVRGRGQQPAVHRRAAAASTPTPSCRASARRTSTCSRHAAASTARRSGGLAAAVRRPRAALRRGRAADRRGRRRGLPTRSRRGAAVRIRCRRARHVRRHPHVGGRGEPRAASVPRPDGRELGALRRPPGVQQLRVLRRVRLPDPRQGRPDRVVAASAADRPVRGAARVPT